MNQPEYGKNTSYLTDFIRVSFKPQLLNPQEIRKLYLKECLSAAQIAAHYGVSKSVIIGWVNRLKIGSKSAKGRMTNPKNYRHSNPPYGYKVKDNKLVINKSEIKVCRAIIDLMGRNQCSPTETINALVARGFKNGKGGTAWGYLAVQKIFKRWKDKL